MPMVRKIDQDQFKVMPWKNGLGFTTEIYRLDRADEMMFRVSTARVEQSGPFSDFTGFERTLVNLGPGIMMLAVGKQDPVQLEPMQSLHFDGGQRAQGIVTSACVDLNVFCREGVFFASTLVRRLIKPEFIPLSNRSGLLIYVIDGELCAQSSDGEEFLVGGHQALIQEIADMSFQGRVMLASSSEEPCTLAVISFRAI